MSAQRPSIGRMVHYVSRGSADGVFQPACRAATVTEADGTTVGLCVQNPNGLFFHPLENGGVPFAADNTPGSWHWPERVE
jgi:hypothetical protein